MMLVATGGSSHPTRTRFRMMFVPLRFGEETVGVLELDHHKNHEYGKKEVAAASTFASQLATAMHIADLRRRWSRPSSGSASRSGRWPRPRSGCAARPAPRHRGPEHPDRRRRTGALRGRGPGGERGPRRRRRESPPTAPTWRGCRDGRRGGRQQPGSDSGRDRPAGRAEAVRGRQRGRWRNSTGSPSGWSDSSAPFGRSPT